ncbi:MAG TPA: TadE family type IV pilus minor pilin [Frankiaceae bacterium]|nr:TadE family type IV pilus minor pilin [Frankiaceae bacterium]
MTNVRERASATAETAVALPALVLVLGVCVWALALAGTALRCAEAARSAARAAARGETTEAATEAARRSGGPGVAVATAVDGELVTVRVTARSAPPLPVLGRLLPPVTITREATARAEPPGGTP